MAEEKVKKEEKKEKDELELLKEENEKLKKEVEEYKDRLLRKVAEFENYKKRLEADFESAVKYASEKLVKDLLPVIDDLERSLEAGKEKKDYDSFYKGIELIYSKILKVLEAHGVKPFDSVGKPFDVYYHDALMKVPRDDVPPNTVVDEVEKGYMFYDKVLRHAKVIVSAEPEKKPEVKNIKLDDVKSRDDHRGES